MIFKIKKQGQVIDTETCFIADRLPTLPKCIKLAYLNIPVEIHIHNPMRCFICRRFGHHKNNWRRKLTCARCGTESHDDTSCENPQYFVTYKKHTMLVLKIDLCGKKKSKYSALNTQ